jgi:rhodanese-related sulfurtransferase
MFGTKRHSELTPQEVQGALNSGKIVLVDVREDAEHTAERIAGALLHPLSSFDPARLPVSADTPVVLHCGSAKRSATALDMCRKAGVPVTAHMAGGIMGWNAAGLPTVSGSGSR